MMGSHRTLPGVAAGLTDPTPVGVIAALAALFLSFWNLHVVLLFILVVGAGVWDLLAGARRAHLREKLGMGDVFDTKRLNDGAQGKLFYLGLSFFYGVSGDSLILLVGNALDLGYVDPFRALTPATAAALFFRLSKEVASINRNNEETPGGAGAVWPLLKFIDAIRWRMGPGNSGPVPHDRWGDHLSDADRRWVEQQLALREEDTEPPEPEQ